MKNIIKTWLDKLAAANKESFGNETLTCCGLNKSNSNKSPQR